MTITIFVEPSCLNKFVQITKTLEGLPLDTSYVFNPSEIKFNETMISVNWFQINMDIAEYFKLKYYINKLNK
jgi:hypothetical protein